MNATRFAALRRTLAAQIERTSSRRAFLPLLSGLLAAAGVETAPAAAKGKKKPKPKPKPPKRTCTGSCNGAECGIDDCGRSCGSCGAGLVCLAGTCRDIADNATFHVSGRAILDPTGTPVVLRGVNKMSVFDDDDPDGAISFPEIRKIGANTVRIVWAITTDLSPNGPKTDPDRLEALIENAIAAGLVPMIELHDATGDWSRLDDLVAYWTKPQIVSIINTHRQFLLVNIGNEVGDDTVTDNQFITKYSGAVQAMRNAGIHTPLVIDAPDWGKNLTTLNNTAAALLNADPDHNLIFSVHLYWGIADGADADFITAALEDAVAANYPLLVGEYSQYGAYNGNASICAKGGRIDYKTIIKVADQYDIGWYAWEWGPGNSYGDKLCAIMDMTPDRRFAHLQPGWAEDVALTSPYSIKKTATRIL
ncbi:MAG: cellulase family glycosylhydrolase [Thermomicrobiales bacterium]